MNFLIFKVIVLSLSLLNLIFLGAFVSAEQFAMGLYLEIDHFMLIDRVDFTEEYGEFGTSISDSRILKAYIDAQSELCLNTLVASGCLILGVFLLREVIFVDGRHRIKFGNLFRVNVIPTGRYKSKFYLVLLTAPLLLSYGVIMELLSFSARERNRVFSLVAHMDLPVLELAKPEIIYSGGLWLILFVVLLVLRDDRFRMAG